MGQEQETRTARDEEWFARWSAAVQAVTDQLHAENTHGNHVSGFCRACAENYLACNLLDEKLGESACDDEARAEAERVVTAHQQEEKP